VESLPTSFSLAGTPVTFSFAVTNTGNATLTGVHISDPLPGLSTPVCLATTLAPAASTTCTASYTTTAGDVGNGSILNTATAVGTQGVTTVTSPQASLTLPGPSSGGGGGGSNAFLTLTKSAAPASFTKPGQKITFSFVVQNNGQVTLNALQFNDTLSGLSAITCPQPSLLAGQSQTCTANYTTTQADVDAGSVSNSATVTGSTPASVQVTSQQSTATVAAATRPEINMVSVASPLSYTRAGTVIHYTFSVGNAGNVTLHNVRIDVMLPALAGVHCPSLVLRPGKFENCTGRYVIKSSDVRAGKVVCVATAQGEPAGLTLPVISPISRATVVVPKNHRKH